MVTTLGRALRDLVAQLARPSGRAAWRADLELLPRALRWALPWAVLGRVSRNASPTRWLELWAQKRPDVVAVEDLQCKLTFAELHDRSRIAAASLVAQGVGQADRVALLLPTSTELVVALFACWRVRAVPCPLDPKTPESLLGEAIARLGPKWCWGGALAGISAGARQLHLDQTHSLTRVPAARIAAAEVALILPTSGSEGTVKLCRITAGRLALSGHAFGGLALRCRRGDVIYCPLPLHHATGITVALMPAMVHGVTLHLAGKFSATRFWQDVTSSNATQLVYVGDLLRFALAATPSSAELVHRLRVAVGNGLDESTWRAVAERLPSLDIIEFYGATEAPSVLLNLSGKCGSIGRVPLRKLSRYVVVRSKDDQRHWTHCAAGEVGELWIRIPHGKRLWLGDFEGYLAQNDAHRAVIEHVFHHGDRYYRTHDLVRYDEDDYLYFVDREGDVWRNSAHNVSTIWLAGELRNVDGIEDACIVPVALDASSRRFGLAVVVASGPDWRVALESKLRSLPRYVQPQLVQVVCELSYTATYKPNKGEWRARRWEPSDDSTSEAYLWREGFEAIEQNSWDALRRELLRSG